METARRIAAVLWAAACVAAFLVVMLLVTIASTRLDGTARDTVFRALGDELWIWLSVFGPLAVLGIAVGRWVTARFGRSHVAVDVLGPPIGLASMCAAVALVVAVLSRF